MISHLPSLCRAARFAAFALAWSSTATAADFDPTPHLNKSLLGGSLASEEVMTYCERRVPTLPLFSSADEWRAFETSTRARVLDKVVFRGEAASWRNYRGKVEWLDEIAGGDGYRIKKLRYEALPGLWIPALLYEPTKLVDKAPVFLNVNGHDGAGKAAPYKQIRCINQAKRGIISLNLEWVGMGQLRSEGFSHAKMNQLDLCGTSGIAPFFLSMQRGLDILLDHPHADPKRVGVAGLSGGGWQTIFISSLDPRVTLCNPVAGYSSFITRARNHSDLGDSEQTPTDLGLYGDYAVLTAMLAPRHALLTFNAADNCCFAAPHALPPLMDAARPVYRLLGQELNLRSHVNYVPGDHNFGLENREALYRVIGDAFFPGDKDYQRSEIESESELKTAEELNVALPEKNEDFNTLAVRLSANLPRTDVEANRDDLKSIVRAKEYKVAAQVDHREEVEGVTVVGRRLKMDDAWTVPCVEFAPAKSRGTVIVIADDGRTSTAELVGSLTAAGERVIAVDPYYFGESKLGRRDWLFSLLIATIGDRPLGVQASQILAVARWSKSEFDGQPVRLISVGPRTGVVAAVAGALAPETFDAVESRGGLTSLKDLIRDNRAVSEMPELFCFGLLEKFDLAQLMALGPKSK